MTVLFWDQISWMRIEHWNADMSQWMLKLRSTKSYLNFVSSLTFHFPYIFLTVYTSNFVPFYFAFSPDLPTFPFAFPHALFLSILHSQLVAILPHTRYSTLPLYNICTHPHMSRNYLYSTLHMNPPPRWVWYTDTFQFVYIPPHFTLDSLPTFILFPCLSFLPFFSWWRASLLTELLKIPYLF